MHSITYNNKEYYCRENESVLNTFLRYGVNVPFSCKYGICHTCILRCTNAKPPELSQDGIDRSLSEKNYFKSCTCIPTQDMSIALPDPDDKLNIATFVRKEQLSHDMYRLKFKTSAHFTYQAGQYIKIVGPDDQVRSYSLASVQNKDPFLEIHVKRVNGGKMSHWLLDELAIGDKINFKGSFGDCFYKSAESTNDDLTQKNLLLISSSTGLSSHIGIVRDALSNGHQGFIHLFHGGNNENAHYLSNELEELSLEHPNFQYRQCATSLISPNENIITGHVSDIAFDLHRDLDDYVIFISGNSIMANHAKQTAQELGATDSRLFFAPFENKGEKEEPSKALDGRKFPDPDPEMWLALENGKLLTEILTLFYDQVYLDAILSPYFTGVTKERLIEKVYSFHYQMFTGEKVFFGERPRNTHHWMVITDDIFEHRETLMENTLREFHLSEHLIERWMKYENIYRADIVKTKPINKILFGEEIPYEGFDTLIMEFSSLCDCCDSEINIGDKVQYHTRMGTVSCSKCNSDVVQASSKNTLEHTT